MPGSLFTTRSPAQFWNAKRTLQELAGHSDDEGRCEYFASGGGGDAAGEDAMDMDEGDEYARWPGVLRDLARAHRRLGAGGGVGVGSDGAFAGASDDDEHQQ